jgi:hypothetical protein
MAAVVITRMIILIIMAEAQSCRTPRRQHRRRAS